MDSALQLLLFLAYINKSIEALLLLLFIQPEPLELTLRLLKLSFFFLLLLQMDFLSSKLKVFKGILSPSASFSSPHRAASSSSLRPVGGMLGLFSSLISTATANSASAFSPKISANPFPFHSICFNSSTSSTRNTMAGPFKPDYQTSPATIIIDIPSPAEPSRKVKVYYSLGGKIRIIAAHRDATLEELYRKMEDAYDGPIVIRSLQLPKKDQLDTLFSVSSAAAAAQDLKQSEASGYGSNDTLRVCLETTAWRRKGEMPEFAPKQTAASSFSPPPKGAKQRRNAGDAPLPHPTGPRDTILAGSWCRACPAKQTLSGFSQDSGQAGYIEPINQNEAIVSELNAFRMKMFRRGGFINKVKDGATPHRLSQAAAMLYFSSNQIHTPSREPAVENSTTDSFFTDQNPSDNFGCMPIHPPRPRSREFNEPDDSEMDELLEEIANNFGCMPIYPPRPPSREFIEPDDSEMDELLEEIAIMVGGP